MTDIVDELRSHFNGTGIIKSATSDLVKVAADEIDRLRAASEWRDISTAPRDGLIDIWLRTGMRWCDCYYDSICDEWRTSRPGGKLLTVSARHVTHWRQAPAPPQRNEVTK